MGRWLAIGAVVGFGIAVLAISVFGGPGDAPAAPVPPVPAALDAGGPKMIPAVETMELPTAAARHLGAMGPPIVVEQAPDRRSRGAVEAQPDAGS